jgi:hypothetical protein
MLWSASSWKPFGATITSVRSQIDSFLTMKPQIAGQAISRFAGDRALKKANL